MPYYSQLGQDEVLDTKVFQGYKRGVFVNVGAYDGVCFDNTLFFERERGWTGINIEPSHMFADLCKNRPNCINLNVAVSDTDGTAEFLDIDGNPGMLSGLHANYDPRHLQRIERETTEAAVERRIVPVQTRRLETIFKEHRVSRVHCLSIDVEGSEFKCIQSINFSAVFIDVIVFENNYRDTSRPIVEYLQQKGYRMAPIIADDIFMYHKDSPFARTNYSQVLMNSFM